MTSRPETGLWRHREGGHGAGMGLDDVEYVSGRMRFPSRHRAEPESAFRAYLETAGKLAAAAECDFADRLEPRFLNEKLEGLRWFPLPGDAAGPGS